jgi:hypothetical protein
MSFHVECRLLLSAEDLSTSKTAVETLFPCYLFTFWFMRINSFRMFDLTTVQTQVPRVAMFNSAGEDFLLSSRLLPFVPCLHPKGLLLL